MRLFLEKSFLKIYTPIFIVLFIIVGSVFSYVYIEQRKHLLTNTVDYYSDFLLQRSELIHAMFAPTMSDLSFMARHRSVISYLDDYTNKSRLIEDMRLFAQYNRAYRQIRFIDETGMEKVRINWENDSLVVVPDSLLQDKSSRPYFMKSSRLKAGEIYVSPIDLNVEHGQIEIPFQPVIRFATPVYDKINTHTGVIVINQYLNDFFNRLEIRDHNNADIFMLLNSEGYWLYGPRVYPAFSFMFSRTNDCFGKRFPDAWNYISKTDNGSFTDDEGVFVFRHLSLGSYAKKERDYWLNNTYSDEANNWTLLVYVAYENIRHYHGITRVFMFLLGALVFLLIFVSYILSRLRFNEKQYIRNLNVINKTLESRIERRTKELSQKNQELKAVNEELESFSYSVSHDLRSPLRHISGFVDLLVKKNKDELTGKGQTYLEYIKGAAAEMGDLIDNLLNFSRIGRAEIKEVSFDMNELVVQITEMISKENKGRDIRWEISDLPRVDGDYSLLRQVWLNLLQNAVKYSSKEKFSKIEIGSKVEKERIVFFVKDNGVGFDMNYSHKLFGTFQRLHSKDDFEGTGIGLAIVRRIVSRHGGETWATGEPDIGAVFYFSLPI